MTLKEKYGSWALITGASSGIGEGFARRLASENMNLILVARRNDRLIKLSEELKKKYNVDIVVAPVDLSKDNFMKDIEEAVDDREIGMLINNAGFGSAGEFADSEIEQQTNMIRVNCIAPTILSHHFIQQMKIRKKGAIIFLGSLVAYQPTPLTTTYSATKVFNLFMSEGLWYELRDYNIDVLALNPGGTDTEFQMKANTTSGPSPRTVEEVINTAMISLGRKISVVDGSFNKLLSFIPRIVTRKFIVKLAGRVRRKYYTSLSTK
ncbi:MAG: SDR family oxidoreductase [Ignavibacteriales bacterium]|nr:SDR family oxidoreductase [Ignavibacteriales bacterium]